MATSTRAAVRVGKHLNRIFVGNLPWTISNRELKQYFSEFGRVINATVIFNKKTGLSRGYGFVTFSNITAIEKIESEQRLYLEGNFLNVQNH